jgi:hypothetical protein
VSAFELHFDLSELRSEAVDAGFDDRAEKKAKTDLGNEQDSDN